MSRDHAPDPPDRPEQSGSLLDVRGLDVHYGARSRRTQVLFGVDFAVRAGESVGVIGETGSGKSTLARAIVGLLRPSGGTVRIDGEDVSSYSSRQWRAFRTRSVIQYMFQDPLRSLDPDMVIRRSLEEPLILRGGIPSAERTERIAHQLERVSLDPALLERFPGELSGGQRQRVLIARALVADPRLLIMDEPVSALDSANRVQVLETLNELRAQGLSLVFISHDLGSVAGVTDRSVVLYRGELVEEGTTAQIVRRPQHPYTRLLVGSAPSLSGGAVDRRQRAELRELLEV